MISPPILCKNPTIFLLSKVQKKNPDRKMSSSQEMSLGSENFFDRLPDEILHSVFSRLHDAKSLCVTMAVCRRFYQIVPQVDQISLRIPRKKQAIQAQENRHWSRVFSKNLFVKTLLVKPLRFISELIKLKPKKEECECDGCAYHTPNEILKPFEEIRSLHVKIPSYGNERVGSKTGKQNNQDGCTNLLKWKAEFGSQMQSCVILGAKSWSDNNKIEENLSESDLISDEELKLRIVWTISCLIAASARHELIQEIVKNQKKIENVVITDESDQGKVSMNREQIEEMRNFKKKGDEIHSLRMKMWYVEKLEVPSLGKVMEGATVVAIRPAAGGGDRRMEELVAAAFGGEGEGAGKMVGEAVGRLMAASRCYTMEISSF